MKEGEKTSVPYLNLYRFTEEKIAMPQTDSMYLYVVAEGSIRLYTPSGIYGKAYPKRNHFSSDVRLRRQAVPE